MDKKEKISYLVSIIIKMTPEQEAEFWEEIRKLIIVPRQLSGGDDDG